MLAEQVRQNQLSNDLSNASTPGYKADHAAQQSFGSLLLQTRRPGSSRSARHRRPDRQGRTDLTPATLQQTGQPLFGIPGTGFFAVRTPTGVRYTRDGQFMTPRAGSSTPRAIRSSLRTARRSASVPRARSPPLHSACSSSTAPSRATTFTPAPRPAGTQASSSG